MTDDDPTALGTASPSRDDPLPSAHGNALPLGARVQEFEIEGLVGEGGFSVVYRARDTLLGRTIALKEYLPALLAQRSGTRQVMPRTDRQRATFELGLRSFVNEARLLASFDHPSLVKVYRFWEENGTAYLVMPLYHGLTLREWLLRGAGEPIDEARLVAMLEPLLDALEVMHAQQCFHRDIAPDNILLLEDDAADGKGGGPGLRPVLLDFGAARRVIGDATQALTVILKPGYAPIEQYAETVHARQGPWTDIYALCATLYFAVSGRVPAPSVGRLMHDELPRAADVAIGIYSPALLAAIDAGMAVKPDDRPPSVAALRELLQGRRQVHAPPPYSPLADDEATVILDAAQSAAVLAAVRAGQAEAGAAGSTAAAGVSPARRASEAGRGTRAEPDKRAAASKGSASGNAPDRAPYGTDHHAPTPAAGRPQVRGSTASPPPRVEPGERTRRHAVIFVAAAALLSSGLIGTWWWATQPGSTAGGADTGKPVASGGAGTSGTRTTVDSSPTASAGTGPIAGSTTAAPSGPANAGDRVVSATPALGEGSNVATSGEPTGTNATSSVAPGQPAAPPMPFSVLAALQDIVAGADAGIEVTATPAKPRLTIGRHRLEFDVTSSQAGYVYVYSGGTDQSHFHLLFPNPADRANRIAANKPLRLPRESWTLDSVGPAGTNHVLVVVSRSPRELGATGIVRRADAFGEWKLDRAAARWAARGAGESSPFVGRPACAPKANECPTGYGAAMFSVVEEAAATR
jgi:serine/threonine protein kinase